MQRFRGDDTLRKIEFVLYCEKEIRLAVMEAKLGVAGHSGGCPTGHAYIADPTAVQAIRNSSEVLVVDIFGGKRLAFPERWLALVDRLRAWAASEPITAGIFLDRYSHVSYQSTLDRLHISDWVYKDRLRKIRDKAKLIAAKMDLIDV